MSILELTWYHVVVPCAPQRVSLKFGRSGPPPLEGVTWAWGVWTPPLEVAVSLDAHPPHQTIAYCSIPYAPQKPYVPE